MLGVKTTVLEVAPRILARVCDEQTGAVVHAAHARHGVDIRVGTTLSEAVLQADGRIAAETGAGDQLIADLVVIGTGSRPDDALAAAAGLTTQDGIVVDAHCRYLYPARYDDEIAVKTWVARANPRMVEFHYEICDSASARELATAQWNAT